MNEHSERVPGMTLDAFAKRVGGRVLGDGGVKVRGIGSVEDAAPDEIALLASTRYRERIGACAAGAWLVDEALVSALPAGASAVVVDDARAALRLGLPLFHPERPAEARVHQTAVIGSGVVLGAQVTLEPYVVIGPGVTIADGVHVGAHSVVGDGSRIGERSHLHPHVVLYAGTTVGRDVVIHSGARIGSDGFGFEIGANSTIDRGSLGDTVVGAGVKIDNLVHIAHNVRVGAHSMLAALVGIAGSTRIGRGAWLGGQSGVCNQAELGDGVRVAVQTGVTRDVPAGETVSGFPGRPHREVLRGDALVRRLPRFVKRLEVLERRAALGHVPAEGKATLGEGSG